jgi:hypothetical protein
MMRHAARERSLLALLSAALLAGIWVSAAHAAGTLGLAEEKWEAGTCKGSEAEVAVKANCSYASNPSKFYTQSAGHPPWGLTGFKLTQSGEAPNGSAVKRLRVDVPPGLAADPQAFASPGNRAHGECSRSEFEANSCNASSQAGFVELKAYLELLGTVLPLKGKVYNLKAEPNLPLLFGIDVEGVEPLVEDVHLYLEGHVSWGPEPSLAARGIPSGDFHEWFEINNVPPEVAVKLLGPITLGKTKLKTVESKLFFNGHAGVEGKENFLTMPSSCTAPSSYLELETYGPTVEHLSAPTTPPVSVEGCDKVPFEPTVTVTPETSQYDTPDGTVTDVHVPQKEKSNETNTADIADAHATLPEGLTLNPSAAQGLEACTQAQLGKGTRNPVGCPASSKIGTVNIETDLPPGSLAGNVYLGKTNGTSAITGPPYLIFIDTESVYDVSVRLEGQAVPNPTTGRLEVSFLGNPQLPFSDLTLTLNGGPRAPLANPLVCGKTLTEARFSPYTTGILQALEPTPYTTTGCPSSIPFALAQSATPANTTAGAYSAYTFNLTRADGQQYLSQVSTTLPAGLLGAIPSVTLCDEPQAAAGLCTAASQIGVASVTAGAGSEPYPLSGPVYLTGPYDGAPYGLSIPVSVAAGPFNLGTVTTRATLNVNPATARVTVATPSPGTPGALPTIVGGVPVRLKTLKVEVNRPSFIFNPTNCSALATESTLTSTFNATQSLSTPFQAGGCASLPFKPKFTASTGAKVSKADGASLQVKITSTAGQANIHEVLAELPKQLPSRLTTLQKACREAIFNANPSGCPKESKVGEAVVATPVLPDKLEGPAYLVSHGGAAFPDLEVVLDQVGPKGEVLTPGVQVVLDGQTHISSKGITSSKFSTVPDVPITSFELSLPTGPYSALTANGSVCAKPLLMPTTITAQSGAVIKQSTRITVTGCPVLITRHRVKGKTVIVTVKVPAAGRISVSGKDMKTIKRSVSKATTITLRMHLSDKGLAALSKKIKLKIKLRVGFVPKAGSSRSNASVTVTFKR